MVDESLDKLHEKENIIDVKRARIERYIFYFTLIFGVMGISYAFATGNSIQSIISWFVPVGASKPNITSVFAYSGNNMVEESTDIYPTFNNSYVFFNVSFSDSDAADWHNLIICNGIAGNYTYSYNDTIGKIKFTCNTQLCNYSNIMVTDNPLSCSYYVAGLGNQTQNYTAYILDSSGMINNRSGIFVVDRPPKITNINLIVT